MNESEAFIGCGVLQSQKELESWCCKAHAAVPGSDKRGWSFLSFARHLLEVEIGI